MIDEEKQQDYTSQQPAEATGTTQDTSYGDVTPEDSYQAMELESLISETSATNAEAVTSEATPDGGTFGDSAAFQALKQENETLKAQLQELQQQSDSFKSQSLRIAADFDNFRKRTSKEKEESEQQIKKATISELLPVVDNFERARSQLKPQTDGEMAIHKSYQGVYKQLVDGLKRLGVSAMRPEGEEFDPNLHEAVMREATSEYPEGAVIEQLMRGYFLGDRVLRHAMVKVAAAPEPVVTSEESTPETSDS